MHASSRLADGASKAIAGDRFDVAERVDSDIVDTHKIQLKTGKYGYPASAFWFVASFLPILSAKDVADPSSLPKRPNGTGPFKHVSTDGDPTRWRPSMAIIAAPRSMKSFTTTCRTSLRFTLLKLLPVRTGGLAPKKGDASQKAMLLSCWVWAGQAGWCATDRWLRR